MNSILQGCIKGLKPKRIAAAILQAILGRSSHQLFNESRTRVLGLFDDEFNHVVSERKTARIQSG